MFNHILIVIVLMGGQPKMMTTAEYTNQLACTVAASEITSELRKKQITEVITICTLKGN